MRILHYYPKNEAIIIRHIEMLIENMPEGAECVLAKTPSQAKEVIAKDKIDLLHIHGCWHNSSRIIAKKALQSGIRIICTPHGQLEPWVMNDRRWKEKIPKELFYQREIIKRAYAVIAMGKQEQNCLYTIGWNPRVEIVRNAAITHSTSPVIMARRTFDIYQKVTDSNVLTRMEESTVKNFRTIIKAGITGDVRWVNPPENPSQWREMFLLAYHEQISEYFNRGIELLHLDVPDIKVEQISSYFPPEYKATESLTKLIGRHYVSENERMIAIFRTLQRLYLKHQITMLHIVELDKEIREHPTDEGVLQESLEDQSMLSFASSIMQVLAVLTGMEEGIMPIPASDDKQSKRIIQRINKHLEI